ncbi:MAG: iduronate-2-sulfatase [Candidatus Omnitrophota bacterium]|nr:MAG: iduronate-2-sulfatase [Candidatus Omnitrophota bacterium]
MQNRREFLKHSIWGAASLSLTSSASYVAQSNEKNSKKPNVLFIAIDDLNDWIGCLGGHPDVKTPNLDRLADRGILFTRTYCSAPACNPSRASLLTGIRPSTSGVYLNNQPWRPVMPDAVTLPRHFKDHGYLVYGRGKIFHGGHSQDLPAWHEYIPRGNDPEPPNKPLNGIPKTAHFDWGPIDVSDEEMDDTKVARWADAFLRQEHDKPFFLACGLFRPHLPWYVPQSYFDLYPPESVTLPHVNETDLDDVPELGRKMAKPDGDHKNVIETNNWRKAVSSYLASISFTDANVGRILDALDRSAYADNTIIVLWGDHGWHLGEKLHWRKFALWEEATRMPLIISLPGSNHRGKRCHRTVSLLDIYPTLAELCGLETRKEWEGNSLAPLLGDPTAEWDRPALTTHGRNNHSVRSERWRYIRYADGSEELYDHDADPLEWTNLAERAEVAEVKPMLAKWLPAVNAPDAPMK